MTCRNISIRIDLFTLLLIIVDLLLIIFITEQLFVVLPRNPTAKQSLAVYVSHFIVVPYDYLLWVTVIICCKVKWHFVLHVFKKEWALFFSVHNNAIRFKSIIVFSMEYKIRGTKENIGMENPVSYTHLDVYKRQVLWLRLKQ